MSDDVVAAYICVSVSNVFTFFISFFVCFRAKKKIVPTPKTKPKVNISVLFYLCMFVHFIARIYKMCIWT